MASPVPTKGAHDVSLEQVFDLGGLVEFQRLFNFTTHVARANSNLTLSASID